MGRPLPSPVSSPGCDDRRGASRGALGNRTEKYRAPTGHRWERRGAPGLDTENRGVWDRPQAAGRTRPTHSFATEFNESRRFNWLLSRRGMAEWYGFPTADCAKVEKINTPALDFAEMVLCTHCGGTGAGSVKASRLDWFLVFQDGLDWFFFGK